MWLLWILSLAASFLLPATGEVVDNFEDCKRFFLDETPPKLNSTNLTRICQVYKNTYRFATMYDTKGRIPLFSAYIYQPGKGRGPNIWKIEPQLALPKSPKKNMVPQKNCNIPLKDLKINQAVTEDYTNATHYGYDRGHLMPVSHQLDPDSKNASFTLTNIVPQFSELNKKKWAEYERNMTHYTTGCSVTYVIVGVVAGENILNERVNIPTHIWAAACCVFQNNQRKSWAVIAQNNQNKVDHLSLGELQAQLTNIKGSRVDLFNNACNATSGLQI